LNLLQIWQQKGWGEEELVSCRSDYSTRWLAIKKTFNNVLALLDPSIEISIPNNPITIFKKCH
jgi:hypothetical protein